MIEYIEEDARAKGKRKVYLKTGITNKTAVCFYIIQGYQFEARMLNFGFKGYDDYYLAKEL